jgi:hypothetical protein
MRAKLLWAAIILLGLMFVPLADCVLAQDAKSDAKTCKEVDRMPWSSEDFQLTITEVRSLVSGHARVGLNKLPSLYSVFAFNETTNYLLYCEKAAPDAGRVYGAFAAYVDADHSPLQLWPEERANLNIPKGCNTKGRVYKVVLLNDVASGKYHNLVCDVKEEHGRK